MYKKVIETRFGKIRIEASYKGITKVVFTEEDTECVENKWILQCEKELKEYFEQKRKTFTLPLDLKGTPFQLQVWNALCNIPYGETRSYKDIAREINNPKACRAIGGANNKNPICILIPCHRVINQNNTLGGYAFGTKIKKQLLEIEKTSK